jgi:hypothetical protein
MTLVLHIGGPKSGSTSVQAALRRNRRLLRCYRISIVKKRQFLGGNRLVKLSSRSLFYAVHRGGRPRGDRNRFASHGEYEEFREAQAVALKSFLEARAKRSRHVIVSDEYLYELDFEMVSRLAGFLVSAGHEDVRVIVYVREPASLFLSLAQQRLKADCRLADPLSWHYPYLDYLDAWERVFQGRLEVRAFDRSVLAGGSVVADFATFVADVVGLQPGVLAELDSGNDANQSLSAEAMDLLWRYQLTFHSRDVGRFTQDGRHLIATLLVAGERLGLEPPRLRQSIRDAIVSRHRAELMGLMQRYGIRFADLDDQWLVSDQVEEPPRPAPPGVLTVHDLIDNLDHKSAEHLRLHCLAELCSQLPS